MWEHKDNYEIEQKKLYERGNFEIMPKKNKVEILLCPERCVTSPENIIVFLCVIDPSES